VSEVPRHLNGKGVTRHYGQLDPGERFRLALEAGARDDDRERARLAQSAPMYPVRVTDPAYTDLVDASRELALVVALDLAPRIATLRLLTAVPELFAGAFVVGATVWAEADDEGQAAVEETARELPAMRACAEVAARSASESAAVLAAFAAICRERMGLEPDVVLRAHLGPTMVAQFGLDELDGVKPDKAQLADWRDLFERQWRRRTGG
jgi:hypothetical protein